MSLPSITRIAAGAALAFALTAPAAHAATDSVVATTARPTPLAAYDGKVLYSAWDGTEYRLAQLGAGVLDVPGSAKPFVADIGPGPDGHTVAVYARGGDLQLYDFDTQRERTLEGTRSAVAGSVSGDRLVFARKRGIYARSLSGDGRARRLADKEALSLDARNSRFAFSGSRQWSHEPWLATQTATSRLTRVPGGGASVDFLDALNPTFAGNSIYWLLARSGEHNVGEIHRYNRAKERDERVTTPIAGAVAGFAYDGGRAYYSVGTEIHLVTGLRFEAAPRIRMAG